MRKEIQYTIYGFIWLTIMVSIKIIEMETDYQISWFILVFVLGLFHKRVFNYIFNN